MALIQGHGFLESLGGRGISPVDACKLGERGYVDPLIAGGIELQVVAADQQEGGSCLGLTQ